MRSLSNTSLSLQNQWEEKKRLNLTLLLFKIHMQHLTSLHYINTIVLYLQFKTKHKPLSWKTESPTLLRHSHVGRAVNREWSQSPALCRTPISAVLATHPGHKANPTSRSKRLPVCRVDPVRALPPSWDDHPAAGAASPGHLPQPALVVPRKPIHSPARLHGGSAQRKPGTSL